METGQATETIDATKPSSELPAAVSEVVAGDVQGQQAESSGSEQIDLCVKAMMAASGLELGQAKTIVYYGLATYYLPDLHDFPTLLIRGNSNTGKTKALEQMSKMLDCYEQIGSRTLATVRDKLDSTPVALIDEGDDVQGLEGLLTLRYSRTTGKQEVNRPKSRGAGKWLLWTSSGLR